MNVSIVTVTYGDRFDFLKHQIRHAFDEGVDQIIIVDNNSEKKSMQRINALKESRIKILSLDSNTGSAYGFSHGMKQALKESESDFIWLMDDDNIPLAGALKALKIHWREESPTDPSDLCLLSFREDRSVYLEAIRKNKPDLMMGPKNSFRGFHLTTLIDKVIKKIKRKAVPNYFGSNECGKVSVAPYSGMFFHKALLKKIGFPDPQYFVYADDYDFSYRITRAGGVIKLVTDSRLKDLETSWHIASKKWWESSLLNCDRPAQIYYGLRNGVHFESNYRTNRRAVYYSNMILYLLLIWLLSFFNKNRSDFRLIIRAVQDGLKQKLGKKDDV